MSIDVSQSEADLSLSEAGYDSPRTPIGTFSVDEPPQGDDIELASLLTGPLAELRGAHVAYGEYVNELLAEQEVLERTVSDCQQTIERQKLEIARLHARPAAFATDGLANVSSADQDCALALRLTQAEADRNAAYAELELAQTEIADLDTNLRQARARLQESAAKLARANARAAEFQDSAKSLARREIEFGCERDLWQEQLEAVEAELTAQQQQAFVINELRARLSESESAHDSLRTRLIEETVRNQSLQSELDSSRRRAVEIANELGELKRSSAEERGAWRAELRQWRLALEEQNARQLEVSFAMEPDGPSSRFLDDQAAYEAVCEQLPADLPAADADIRETVKKQFDRRDRERTKRRGK